MTAEFTLEQGAQVLADATMPGCVRELGLTVEHLGKGSATLRMRPTPMACREGGIYAGQALSALADTAMCFAIWTDGRGRRPVATVDLHMTFLSGGGKEDLLAKAEIVRSGRTLSFCKVSMVLADSGKDVASAMAIFSLPA
ncbi:PaaI family thioesterase [Variovorax fucosicus]|uniref:PaaI family thioesterase n=1 Tax=Variovorax fucosicus TaxID=3053517 RepID=UPI002577C57A|nr:PaaI family thioesterase [Variovorax sp. J22G47]MDM0058856.1 PaaI family thioesterase [Variovorax sp. J22G47]